MGSATEEPRTSSGSKAGILGLLTVSFIVQSGGRRDRLSTATGR